MLDLRKQKVSLYLGVQLWRQFRMACFERGTSASQEITQLIALKLAQWAQEKGRAKAN